MGDDVKANWELLTVLANATASIYKAILMDPSDSLLCAISEMFFNLNSSSETSRGFYSTPHAMLVVERLASDDLQLVLNTAQNEVRICQQGLRQCINRLKNVKPPA